MNTPTVAIYCRLSKEDLDKEDKTESESIKNQKIMLEKYALERCWNIFDFYIDEDYSGSDRDRPEFNRMITDSLLGRFNIVLCKKQARFARDIEYIEKYVHGLFSERQIRFVAVLDSIDTGASNRSVKKASQINSLVDEWYLSDLSENIISSLTTKRKSAEFIGSWAPYGYRKDPENKNALLIDPEAAENVREIYRLYLLGYGVNRIAQLLNQREIPNPLLYKQQNKENINPNPSRKTIKRYLWSPSTVSSILHNRVYQGDMVQGKYKKANYKSKKLLRVPPSDWIIVQGSHQPIIEAAVFQAVQSKLASRNRVSSLHLRRHILAGKVYCGECGSRLIKSGGTSGKRKIAYLCCSSHNLSKDLCPGARIELSDLENLLLTEINAFTAQYFDIHQLMEFVKFQPASSDSLKQTASFRLKELQDYKKNVLKKAEILYQDKLDGIVSRDQYLFFRDKLNEELKHYEAEELAQQKNLLKLEEKQADTDGKLQIIESFRCADCLTQEMADQFIDSVYVYKKKKGEAQQVIINWSF